MRQFSTFLAVIVLATTTAAFAQTDVGPALGEYYCDYGGSRFQLVFGPGRTFFLQDSDHYHADDGKEGTWSFDEATRLITFAGGFFDTIDAVGEFIGGTYSQIDIAPADGVYTFCALQE